MSKPRSVIELLRDLVAIPSVNPAGDPGTEHVGEKRIAHYIGDYLKSLSAEVSYEEVLPGRPNVYGVFRAHGRPKRRIGFAPHSDTVSVKGMTVPPFDPQIRHGCLFGRGATDTKGPMASMLWALAAWSRSRPARSKVEVTFAALAGEEHGNDGAYAWSRHRLKFDLVLVGEPTSLRIVHAHKGCAWLRLGTRGVACHASEPSLGRNAIAEMARGLAAIERHAPEVFLAAPHTDLGPATFSVGRIAGGSKVNIVPDFCETEVDIRTVPGFGPRQAVRALRKALRLCDPKVAFTIETIRESPALATSAVLPAVRELLPHTKGITTAPWFCDAAVLALAKVPAIAIGPGSIAQAHTRDEFIRISEVEAAARSFHRYLTACEN